MKANVFHGKNKIRVEEVETGRCDESGNQTLNGGAPAYVP